MYRPSRLAACAVATSLLAALPLGAQSMVRLAASLDAAIAEAKDANTAVAVIFAMPGQRASDELLESHFPDAKIAQLADRTVNLYYPVEAEGAADGDERTLREHFLRVAPDARIVVPQVLFLRPEREPGEADDEPWSGPDATLISAVAHRLTTGQLEWAWADALGRVDASFTWTPTDRTRAPETIRYGEAYRGPGPETPPTKEQVATAIKTLKAGLGWREFGRIIENYRIVVSSGERSALKYGKQSLRDISDNMKRSALRLIGDLSPRPWHELAASFLDDRSTRNRTEAARALEQLAEPKSLTALKKAFRREKDDAVRGRLLRAMAIIGPTDRGVAQSIQKVLDRDRSAEVRCQAAAAAGVLEARKSFEQSLAAGLADDDASVRSVAAFAMAARRDPSLRQQLEAHLETEDNTEVRQWITAGLELYDAGDIGAFDKLRTSILDDRVPGSGLAAIRAFLEGRRREPGDGDGDGDSGGEKGKGEGGGASGEKGAGPGGKKKG